MVQFGFGLLDNLQTKITVGKLADSNQKETKDAFDHRPMIT